MYLLTATTTMKEIRSYQERYNNKINSVCFSSYFFFTEYEDWLTCWILHYDTETPLV